MRSSDYLRVEKAIRYLEENAADQPGLEEVAEYLGLSPFHFQRIFTRWAGVSPKRFLQYITASHAKKLLRESTSVLDTTFEIGLSSPGRLHDLFISVEAMTPGQYKQNGGGIKIRYGVHETPFGKCLLAETEYGICNLLFIDELDNNKIAGLLKESWKAAEIFEDSDVTGSTVQKIFGDTVESAVKAPLKLQLSGTNFQIKVWNALLSIPEGHVTSYSDVARRVGRPKAARAVANAVGRNPIAYLIPCHRVLRSSGEIGGYRWGTARKRAMLTREMVARQE
jgi:AraC family transcriptional regulator of adaptative response/methylated-DNA-[protein]-cysteine methyltransferase